MDNIRCSILSQWATSNFRVGSYPLDMFSMAWVKANSIKEIS